jgi:hypothetical protein
MGHSKCSPEYYETNLINSKICQEVEKRNMGMNLRIKWI